MIEIWMENRAASEVIGNSNAPYETALARACATATNYTEIRSPSLPNYIAATSGDTWGIEDNGPPTDHPLSVVSVFEQAPSWREYEESAPGPCPSVSTRDYAQKHSPALYYTRIAGECRRFDLPLGRAASGNLARDLRTNRLPAFAVIIPNVCHDTHDCSVKTGDEWLAMWLPVIFASRAYQDGNTAVFLAWDESSSATEHSIPFIAASKALRPGTVLTRPMNHYSLLRVTEQLLRLRLLRNARRASTGGLDRALGMR